MIRFAIFHKKKNTVDASIQQNDTKLASKSSSTTASAASSSSSSGGGVIDSSMSQGFASVEQCESRATAQYTIALEYISSGEESKACTILRNLTENEPLLKLPNPPSQQLRRLKYLILKNYANVLRSLGQRDEALRVYAQATHRELVSLSETDTVLWQRFGNTAADCGQWALARYALEKAVLSSPLNVDCLGDLLSFLVLSQDRISQKQIALQILELDPVHELASSVPQKQRRDACRSVTTISPGNGPWSSYE